MIELYKNIGKFSLNKEALFINGEEGSGKELLAKTIHNFDKKNKGDFFLVNGNIGNYIDRVLFGEEVYVDNILLEIKHGYFEKANKGTILIKDFTNLSLDTQSRILDFINTDFYKNLQK